MPRGGSRPGAGRPRKTEPEERVVFTNEEIGELLNSPHVSHVSRKTVSYTLAFKEMFWQRYCDGVNPVQIFEEAGLNVKILGRPRIFGLAKTLRKHKERGVGFNDGNEPHASLPDKKFGFPVPPRKPKGKPMVLSDEDISKMFHKIAYMSQELEFIKKIILAGKEGK